MYVLLTCMKLHAFTTRCMGPIGVSRSIPTTIELIFKKTEILKVIEGVVEHLILITTISKTPADLYYPHLMQ